jgi:SAM-dependent methyltransferase
VAPWQAGLGKVRDLIRQELVARQLAACLDEPAAAKSVEVLDVGCGQGTQAIRLAEKGFEVTGIDLSDELLELARAAAAEQSPPVRQRLRFEHGDLLDLGEEHKRRFGVVCCHGVLMYLPSLEAGVSAVVNATRPGGLVSILTRNRAGIAMRAGMSGNWAAALSGFDARFYRNRLGIDAVRADEPDEVAQELQASGAERIAWYGVRLFSDHWGSIDSPEDFATLVSAEEEAGRRDPYRSVAALTHTIGRRFESS